MKKNAIRCTLYAVRLTCALLMAAVACSPKYFAQGTLDPGFDTKQTYKVAVMPFLVRGLQSPGAFERDMAYGHLCRRLMETGRLLPMDMPTVINAVLVRGFGQQSTIDPATAREIGKELGADLICLAELDYEMVEPKLLVTTVQLLNVNATTAVYSGLGRMANPLSVNAAAEFALDLATKKLVEKMR